MKITIDKEIMRLTPGFSILAYAMDVTVHSTPEVQALIAGTQKDLRERYTIEEVISIPVIREGRDAYKKYGKDPSRYRLAVESLFRRIVKGYDLYTINDVVDVGNILSIRTMRSTAILDADKIQGNIHVRLGTGDDDYEGINRGKLDISNIPVYVDEVGPFGSTTSDTDRTSVSENTRHILVFIICFSKENLAMNINEMMELYTKYIHAENIRPIEVTSED